MKQIKQCMAVLLCLLLCTVSTRAEQFPQDADTQGEHVTLEAEQDIYEAMTDSGQETDTYEITSEPDYASAISRAVSPATAARTVSTADQAVRLPIVVNGKVSDISAYLFRDGVSYLPLRAASALLFPTATVGWDAKSGAATLRGDGFSLNAKWGEPYIEVNGRYFGLSGLYPPENLLVDGVTYVPLRSLARAAGADITWNKEAGAAEIVTGQRRLLSGDEFYDADEVYWLSKIIYAESGDQSLRGQMAVGAVILNRQAHPSYPNTVYGVIFDRKYGVQFSPTADGAINKTPSQKSIIAAKLVLDGSMISYAALYFLDPDMATSFWIVENCEYLFTIGCHDFYI